MPPEPAPNSAPTTAPPAPVTRMPQATSTPAPAGAPKPYTVSSFASALKQKYPDGVASDGTPYAKMSDGDLVTRVVTKYPVYANQIEGYKQPTPAAQPTKPTEPNLGELTGAEQVAGAKQAAQGVKEGADIMNDTGNDTSLGGEVKMAGGALHAGAQAVIGAGRSLFAPITAIVQNVINKSSDNPDIQKAAQSPELSKFLDMVNKGSSGAGAAWDKVEKAHPTLARAVSDGLGVAGTVAGGEGGEAIPKPNLAEGIEAAKGAASDIAAGTGKAIDTGKEIAATATKNSETKAVASAAKDWQSPTTLNKPAFNKARAVLAKDGTIPKFLAEQGLDPSAHVEDGKYNTQDTGQALRDTASKMSNDTLRPSLQMADYSTPKTSVSDLVKNAISEAQKDTGSTEGAKATIIKNITKEGNALEKKFPDGMGLTDMHDSKITYAKNGGYSPIKSASDNNLATSNRSLASAMQKMVETKAPTGVPVKEFNGYLSKYFKGADYLDTLHGKTAPVSIAKQIARGAAKFGGAAIGGHFGGGVVSEFAGYQIGKALEHAAENLSKPMRASFLSNLEVTNPEAFKKVASYLSEKENGGSKLLRLPPATSDTPIPMKGKAPAPTQVFNNYDEFLKAQGIERQAPDLLQLTEGKPNASRVNNGLPIKLPAESESTRGARETARASTSKQIREAIESAKNGPKQLRSQNPIILKPKS